MNENEIQVTGDAQTTTAADALSADRVGELNVLIKQMRDQVEELRASGLEGDELEQQLERITRLATEAAAALDNATR